MLLTKASEYALFSLIYIAQNEGPQDVDTISKELNISKSFLAKILQNLAKEGVLISYKGVNGGFVLAKDACKLTLLEILNKSEKRTTSVFECSHSKHDCQTLGSKQCKIWQTFNELQKHIDDYLLTITLQDIIKGN